MFMPSEEKTVNYTTTNSYSTLNHLSDTTENIWLVLHGIGYLSRYFLRHFESLPADKNYIIAPQAPSKYYLGKAYTHVGASWLTQEDTQQEIENIMAYLDAVMSIERLSSSGGTSWPDRKFIVFGFSQGVSIATRWVAQRQVNCHQLVIYAGGIPDELRPSDFEFLRKNKTRIKILVGDRDEYLNPERQKKEERKIEKLFGNLAQIITFEGGHEVKKELVESLVR